MTDEHEHDWRAGVLGSGVERCAICTASRPRQPADDEQEEARLRYAELGFRNGALYVADEMSLMAQDAATHAQEAKESARTLDSAAKHARLIANGRKS